MCLQAFDSLHPANKAQSDLTIIVQRNSNGPVFSLTNYTFNVEKKFAVGGQIGPVKATNLDGVS